MWTPDPATIITAEQKAATEQERLKLQFQNAIQAHVDQTAVTKDYKGGDALAGYVASTIPQWASEAQAFVAWRDAVWLYAYTELAKTLSGQRPIPTIEDFIEELPAMVWPSN